MKKVLVTGGWGFVGSHLTERLVAEGIETVALDNGATGKRENLEEVAASPLLRVVEADVRNLSSVERCFEGVDTVFHLAAMADIVPSIENPTLYYESNVLGTLRVMEAARKFGVSSVIYAASSSCYGIPDEYPTPESAPIRPQYPYALTKTLGEETVLHWGNVYKMKTVSLRCFNIFGPRHRTSGSYGAVFGVFLAQKLAAKPLTIVGDGTQTRDFTYVSDVVEAFVCAARSGVSGEILNVGSGGTTPVNRLAELIGGEKVHLPKRPGEPEATFADISKIGKVLGWRPKVTFEEGVARVLEQIACWKDAPVWTKDSIEEATKGWFRYLS